MATTNIITPLIPIDRVHQNSIPSDGPSDSDMPVFSGGSLEENRAQQNCGHVDLGGRPLANRLGSGENDPESPALGKESLEQMCQSLRSTGLSDIDGFTEFLDGIPSDYASRLIKAQICRRIIDILSSDLALSDQRHQVRDVLNGVKERSVSASANSNETNVTSKLDQAQAQLDMLETNLSEDLSTETKESVLTPKNLHDLGLEDDRVRHPNSKSTGSRRASLDAIWYHVDPKASKSSSSPSGRKSGSRSTGSDSDLQCQVWSDSSKQEVQQILTLLPPQTDEQKNLAAKLLRRMKFGAADRLLKSYLSLYSREKIYPSLTEENGELLLLLVEDLLPGYQQSSPAFQTLYENSLPMPELLTSPSTQNGRKHKGGNSGKKFAQARLNSLINSDLEPLPSPSGENRCLEAKIDNDSTQHHDGGGSKPLGFASTTLKLIPKSHNSKDSTDAPLSETRTSGDDDILPTEPDQPLPKYLRFKQGDKVVIATLHSNSESPVSDHAIKTQEATYLLEPYTLYKKKMIPWHDLDPDFPSRPFEINAAQLVDLAGRRWAGREDLEQKRSLLAHGYENCYHTNFVDKLNLMRDNFIRVLDVVLGDKTKGKVFEPEEIPCVNSTYSMVTEHKHAKIWVKPGFERRKRAFTLLNMNVDHYIFPLTSDELRKGIVKRTSCCQNEAAWKEHLNDIIRVCQSLMFDKESVEDVKPGDFLNFAREMISRKGLSEGESMPLFAAAKYAEFLLETDGSNERILSMLTYCLERETKVFVKDEEYEKTDTALRFIVSPHAFVKVVFGTVFRPVEEKLYFDDKSPLKKHLIKGKTQEEVRQMLTSMPKKENEVYCEVDAKAFESSQNERTLRWEYRIYSSFYKPDSLAYAIIQRVKKSNCRPGWMYNKFFRILRNAMRLSGLNTTACGNALWNYINLVAVCGVDPDSVFYLEGDDGILVLAVTVALCMTEKSLFPLTFLMADKWSDLSFCGHHYDSDGRRVISRESLVRKLCTYFSSNPINRRKAYELLYLRLLSFQISYPDNPYLDDLIDEVNAEYSDVRSAGVRLKTVRQWYKENWWRFENRIGELKLPADTSFVPNFHKLYDSLLQKVDQCGEILLPKEQVQLVNYCLSECYSSKASNIGNFCLSILASSHKFWRRLRGHRSRLPENCLAGRPLPPSTSPDFKEERRARYHDRQIDYLNQFSWFRKLSSKLGWSVLKYTDRALVGPTNDYFPDTDFELVLCTRAFNHEWNKLMRLDELAINGPLGPGRAKGVRAL